MHECNDAATGVRVVSSDRCASFFRWRLFSASEASKAKNTAVATQAKAVATSTDLAKAKASFAKLSDEMIKVQKASAKGQRPAVYYCSMVKKSWLQEKGKVGNPYDASMQMCGELKSE